MRTQLSEDASHMQKMSGAARRSAAEAPWHSGLSPAATEVLALPALRALPSQTVDVAVVGGGVAGGRGGGRAASPGRAGVLWGAAPRPAPGAARRDAGGLTA